MTFRNDIICPPISFAFTIDSLNHTLALSISKIKSSSPLASSISPGFLWGKGPVPSGTKAGNKSHTSESVMQKKFKSWDSERTALATFAAATLLCLGFASTTQVFAQRAGRPPSGRQLEGTPILPSGTRVIPDGTVLIIEMDTKLNSGTAQVSGATGREGTTQPGR